MLFDPAFIDEPVNASGGAAWQPPVATVTRHRPADCVLTLPDFASDVPQRATVRWRSDASIDAVVLEQFKHGPLRAGDATAPISPVDAFQQAFFAWVARELGGPLRFLSFRLQLLDSNAANDVIAHHYSADEFRPASPLHLGVMLDNEWVHEVGLHAQPLRDAHPLLLHTMFSLVDRVSGKTVLVRTPGWFLCEAACRHWEGDERASDESAREVLMPMYEDEEMVQRYLPSALRPDLCPDELYEPPTVMGRRSRSSVLSEGELRQVQSRCEGLASTVCAELIALSRLLRRAGRSDVLSGGFDANPLYSGCTFVLELNDRVGELLDDFMEGEYQGGEASEYSRFIPFSDTREAIREQYAQWSLGLQMLRHLDRLLALVVDPN